MKRFIFCIFLGLCLLGAAPARAEMPMLGAQQLLDMITQAKGKVVLVNFFGAYCPPCRKEIPSLIKIRSEVPEDKLLIVGVGVDEDPADTEEYVMQAGVNYPTFWSLEAAMAFQIESIPHNIIYNQEGKAVFNDAGLIPEKKLINFLNSLMEVR